MSERPPGCTCVCTDEACCGPCLCQASDPHIRVGGVPLAEYLAGREPPAPAPTGVVSYTLIPCVECGSYVNTRFWPDQREGEPCHSCRMAAFVRAGITAGTIRVLDAGVEGETFS